MSDEREAWETLKQRDRAIQAKAAEATLERQPSEKLARFWLSERLRQSPSLDQAAESVERTQSLAGQVLCLLGFLFGLSVAFAALSYTGVAPVNVSAFFGLFILLQALLALLLLIPVLLPRRVGERLLSGPLSSAARWCFLQLLKWAQKMTRRFLEAQQRSEAAEVAGIARSRLTMHRRLFRWLAFTKLQAASLCFNLGALSALLLAVAFSDRAFGWQTTLDVSAESVHELTRSLALPWSWLYGEGLGYPSLEDVRGSRIVLKDGIRSLQTRNLSAWWRFLALGILCYGVLPRLVLRALGGYQLRQAVREYDFSDAASQRLLDRIGAGSPLFAAEAVQQGATGGMVGSERASAAGPLSAGRSVLCLISEDLRDSIDSEALAAALHSRWSLPVGKLDLVYYDANNLERLRTRLDEEAQLAVVVESWLPPIKETERQIKALRSVLGNRRLIRIVPLGLPEEGAVSLSPAPSYRAVWDGFVRRIGDPYLMLEGGAG